MTDLSSTSPIYDFFINTSNPLRLTNDWAEYAAFQWGITMCLIVGYWLPNLVLFFVYKYDLFPHCRISYQYPLKLPNDQRFPPRWLIWQCIRHNLLVVVAEGPLLNYFLLYPCWKGTVFTASPSLLTILWQVVFCFFWADGLFYWSHRLFHTKWLYAKFHKKHHTYRWTVGLAANHAHPAEELGCNFMSTFAGPYFLILLHYWLGDAVMNPMHPAALYLYFTLRMQESVEEHSGYIWTYSPWRLLRSNEAHEYHHSHNVGNYGTFPFWDWAMGTDRHYRKWRKERRSFLAGDAAEALAKAEGPMKEVKDVYG